MISKRVAMAWGPQPHCPGSLTCAVGSDSKPPSHRPPSQSVLLCKKRTNDSYLGPNLRAQFQIKSADHLKKKKKHPTIRSWQPELPQGPSVGTPLPQPESPRSSTYNLLVLPNLAAWSDHPRYPSLPSSFNLHNHPQSPVLIHHRFNPRAEKKTY